MKNLILLSIIAIFFSCSKQNDPQPAARLGNTETDFDYRLHYNVFQANGGSLKSVRQDSCGIFLDGTNLLIKDTVDHSKNPDKNQFSFQCILEMTAEPKGKILIIQLNPFKLGKNYISTDATLKNCARVINFEEETTAYTEKMTADQSYIDFVEINSTFAKAEYFIYLETASGEKKSYHGKMYIDLTKQGNNIGL